MSSSATRQPMCGHLPIRMVSKTAVERMLELDWGDVPDVPCDILPAHRLDIPSIQEDATLRLEDPVDALDEHRFAGKDNSWEKARHISKGHI